MNLKIAKPLGGITPEGTPIKPAPPTEIAPITVEVDKKPSTPAAPNAGWNEAYRNIYDMQQEVLNLHDDISSDPDFASGPSTVKTAPETGNSAFLNFMLDNYAQGETIQYDLKDPEGAKYYGKGKEITDSSGKTYKGFGAGAKGKETYDIRKIMDSIKAIGQHVPGKVAKPDGRWGEYTNNALKNVSVFASAMVTLQKDLNLPSESYSQKDSSELASFIPSNSSEISLQDKTKRAVQITANIKKLRALFAEFKTKVFENPDYKTLIAQKNKFPTSIGPGGFGEKKSLFPIQKSIDPTKVEVNPSNKYEGKFETHDVFFDVNQNKWKYVDPNANLLGKSKLTKEDQDTFSKNTVPVFYINRALSSEPGSAAFDKTNNAGVTLKDIANLDSFKEFLKAKNITIDNQPAISNKNTILKAYNKIKESVLNNKVYVPETK